MTVRYPKTILAGILSAGLLLTAPHRVWAQESVQELKQQIDALKAKVAELESRQNIPLPGAVVPRMMGQSHWDPLAEMERMHNEMERMFNSSFSQTFSPQQGMFSNQLFFDNSQIKETKDGYLITLNIAGFDKDKLEINVDEHAVSISGEYKGEEKQQGKNSVFESHSYGKFLNTIPLPKDADVTKMKTEKKGDHLEIFLPKKTA